ncbi:MAG: decaprenylphosphoryl-beta-D-ribose oxidase, partial [Acidimicrobiales bacterium]
MSTESEIAARLQSSPAVIARGLGRSYGDAAQVSGGSMLRTHISTVGPIDERGVVLVGAGASLDQVLNV